MVMDEIICKKYKEIKTINTTIQNKDDYMISVIKKPSSLSFENGLLIVRNSLYKDTYDNQNVYIQIPAIFYENYD